MSRGEPDLDPTTKPIVMGILKKAPLGLTLKEIQAIAPRSLASVQRAARELLSDGKVCRELAGARSRTVYCLPARIPAVRAHYVIVMAAEKEERRLRRLRHASARSSAKWAAKSAKVAAATEEWFEAPMVQRIIPAHLAEPLRPRGPCSVWAMAA